MAGNGQVAFGQKNRGLLTISTSAAAPEGEKALRATDPASNAAAKQGNSARLASLRIQLLHRSDTFSLTNANCAVADASLRQRAQGGGISQSPQENPASAIYISVDPDAIGTCHHLAPAQIRDDFAAPATRLAGIGFIDKHHVIAGLPGFPG